MTPLTVLGGYLGAGKTTIVNGLLASLAEQTSDLRLAVLVNDFGAVNIDAALIRKHRGRTLELTNGCLCCDIRDDLGGALDALRLETIDQVLIEASGVAYPAKVAEYAHTWPGYRLASVLVAVDAQNVLRQRTDKFVGHLIDQQIAEADLLLVTKLDQMDNDAAQALNEWLPGPSVRIDHGRGDADILLESNSVGTISRTAPDHASRFHTFSHRSRGTFDHRRLEALLNQLPQAIVRAKGWVHDNEGVWWLQSVGDRWTLEPAPEAPEGNTLVFIALADTITPEDFARISGRLDGAVQHI